MSRKGKLLGQRAERASSARSKQELILRPLLSRDGTRTLIFEYLEVYYSPKRRHSTLGS